ncbi:MAG: hypothetical protein EZS28_006614 [Streblomastix strix]|uniref:SPRY domain-containing protein n=1 Tax=Streblomastix strix TaxID=222440 RepID=A0A5J4WUL5_9EUKA|nr:MAG: hypothetical protein EZS28_006614 [Streblomastix strix]
MFAPPQQKSNSPPPEQIQLIAIYPNNVISQNFTSGKDANCSFPKPNIIKHDDIQQTIVVFSREINSGVWEFVGRVRKQKYDMGIGIIDGKKTVIPHPFIYQSNKDNNTIFYIKQNVYIKGAGLYSLGNQLIKQGDEITAIVDLTSNPKSFCLKINSVLQPFCVISVPERVKFILYFSNKDEEWEFVSLKEVAEAQNLSHIHPSNRHNYK